MRGCGGSILTRIFSGEMIHACMQSYAAMKKKIID
jgi:hypothetical protein